LASCDLTKEIGFFFQGFYCHPTPMTLYGLLNLSVGIAGSTLPFMRFFNERRNKKFRILFFVSMAFSALGPIAHMALQNGLWRTLAFIKPMRGMIGSYFFGLWFYGHHCWSASLHRLKVLGLTRIMQSPSRAGLVGSIGSERVTTFGTSR
jgi:predicted membrane channel-forming protein YqfA (hemolysin III family)